MQAGSLSHYDGLSDGAQYTVRYQSTTTIKAYTLHGQKPRKAVGFTAPSLFFFFSYKTKFLIPTISAESLERT